jgi:hypothetical protein
MAANTRPPSEQLATRSPGRRTTIDDDHSEAPVRSGSHCGGVKASLAA